MANPDNTINNTQIILTDDFNMFINLNEHPNEEAIDDLDSSLIKNHVSGGLPMISDSMFSLVILIYVSGAFCFVFFMFCWNNESGGGRDTGMKQRCILMKNNDATWGESGGDEANIVGAATPATLKNDVRLSAGVTSLSAPATGASVILFHYETEHDNEDIKSEQECTVLQTHMLKMARREVTEGLGSESMTVAATAGEDG